MKMTAIHMSNYELYWTNGSRYEPIASVIPSKRYKKLPQFLHGNDNTQANGNWPFKVASVLKTVRKNCPVRKWNWNVITLLTNKHTSKDKI